MTSLTCQRDAFELPDDLVYLNAAYISPSARAVRAAGDAGVGRKSRPWELAWPEFFRESERARAAFAGLIGARADDVAITPSTSFGVTTAARNLPLSKGGRIVVLADQHPSNVHAWRTAAAAVGADVSPVRWPGDHDWTAAVLEQIDAATQVVALPNCHWVDGSMLDLEAIAARARSVGAAVALDLTQSLGVIPFDVARVPADFIACACYKWLLGPYSFAFLYAAPHRQTGRPLDDTPFARAAAPNPPNWGPNETPYTDDFLPGARRYDVGERANFALTPMAIAALELIQGWTPAAIGAYTRPLVEAAAARFEALGLAVPPAAARGPHMLSARLDARLDAERLRQALAERRIFVSMRGGALRLSPHVYNTMDDMERLFEALEVCLP